MKSLKKLLKKQIKLELKRLNYPAVDILIHNLQRVDSVSRGY